MNKQGFCPACMTEESFQTVNGLEVFECGAACEAAPKTFVIMNEQHSLLPEQREILDKKFPGWQFFPVPVEGWNLEEMDVKIEELKQNSDAVIFVSPVPYILMRIAKALHPCYIFHNDRREKKEVAGGKIIYVVAQTGWRLV